MVIEHHQHDYSIIPATIIHGEVLSTQNHPLHHRYHLHWCHYLLIDHRCRPALNMMPHAYCERVDQMLMRIIK